MKPIAVIAAAFILLIVSLLALAHLMLRMIERALDAFGSEDSVPARHGGSQGPVDAAQNSAAGPNDSFHGHSERFAKLEGPAIASSAPSGDGTVSS